MRPTSCAILIAAGFGCGSEPQATAPRAALIQGAPTARYTVAYLPTLGGTRNRPTGINSQGVVAGWGLRAITGAIGALSPLGSDAHTLLQSASASGSSDATSGVDAACRAGIRYLLVVPLADAVTLPETRLPNGVLIVPAFHGGLLGRLDVQTKVRAFLDGQRVRTPSTWIATAEVIAGGASAWRVPVVVPHLPQSCANGKRPRRQQSMPTQSPDSGVRGSPGRVA